MKEKVLSEGTNHLKLWRNRRWRNWLLRTMQKGTKQVKNNWKLCNKTEEDKETKNEKKEHKIEKV